MALASFRILGEDAGSPVRSRSKDAKTPGLSPAAAKLRQYLLTKPDVQTADSVNAILAEWALDEGTKKAR